MTLDFSYSMALFSLVLATPALLRTFDKLLLRFQCMLQKALEDLDVVFRNYVLFLLRIFVIPLRHGIDIIRCNGRIDILLLGLLGAETHW